MRGSVRSRATGTPSRGACRSCCRPRAARRMRRRPGPAAAPSRGCTQPHRHPWPAMPAPQSAQQPTRAWPCAAATHTHSDRTNRTRAWMTASTPLFEKLKEISILSEAVDEEEVRTPNPGRLVEIFLAHSRACVTSRTSGDSSPASRGMPPTTHRPRSAALARRIARTPSTALVLRKTPPGRRLEAPATARTAATFPPTWAQSLARASSGRSSALATVRRRVRSRRCGSWPSLRTRPR